jgi:hypothetical protein
MAANREILMKFITGQAQKVREDVSRQGYKDDSPYRNNPSNTIYGTPEGTSITMEGVSTPLIGIDEFGNRQEMFPGQRYEYPGSRVIETPMAKYGGLLNKTIKCSNCGWSWKAADGGNDVTTCHKCGNENTIMQDGGEKDFNKVKEWFNNYIDSPLYKRNLENSGYLDVDKVINQRKSNVGKTEYVYDENRLGTYYQPNTNTVHHAPEKDSEIWSKEYESVLPQDTVLAHEFGHSVLDDSKSFFGKQTPGYNRYDYEQLQTRNKDRKISRGANENYADQKALQYEAAKLGIYKPGFEEFTKEHLDKLPVHIKDRALKNYSEEDLIWLMNNIAQNNNNTNDMLAVAQEGGEPSSTLEGLTDEERQRKIEENTTYQLENIKKVREEEKIKEEEAKRKAQEEHNAFIKKNFNPDAVEKRKNLFDKVVSENEYPSTFFHEEWMNSPQYKKLLTESTVENNSFDLYNDIRNRNLQELKGKKINTSEDSYKPGAVAYFSPEERTINYPFDRNELDTLGGNFSNDFNRGVAVHEKSHFIDNLFAEGQKKFRLNSRLLRKELKNREDDEVSAIPLKDVDLINSLKVPKTDDNKFKYDYFTEPTEVRARLNEVRDNLYNSGNKEFLNRELNEEDLKSLYNDIDLNTNQGFKDLNDYFGKEGTLKLLNSVSQNDNNLNNQMPVAKRGGTWFGNADMMSVSNKYQEAGTVTSEERKPYMGYPPVNGKWLGNKLTKEGYITSTTKGGNRISFTGNVRADDWINKQIDSGKFGFDPATGGTFPLKKPVKGLSKEDQFIGSRTFDDLQAPQGFTTESQEAQIKKLPEWQQDIINEVNTKRRKAVVRDQWDEVYKSPLWYAPGVIATGGLGLLGLEAAGAAAAPYITGALATQLPGMAAVPGATVGNAITAGFAGHGLANVGPDTVEMYKNPNWSNAGSLGMDILEIAPIAGPAAKTIGEGLSATRKALGTEEGLLSKFKPKQNYTLPEYMSLEAPKGNMYGENQVLVQQQRLLNPDIKAKFFEHQAPEFVPSKPTNSLLNFEKSPKDFGNRITPENYEDFVNRIHGSTAYDFAASSSKKPGNLGVGNYDMPGKVFKDAPLNQLGKDIINAHEKNHGIFAGTLSKEMQEALLKPFGTKKAVPHYAAKHQADEVLARMAQFKNAVGIGDNQIFTLGHLNLIRKNYAKQFLDNSITEMLAKIKPGSAGEKEFLKNMNKYAFGVTGAGALTYKALQEEDPKYKQGGLIEYQEAGTVKPTNTSDKNTHTREMAQRVVQLAEERIRNNNYVDVPKDIEDIAKARGESAFSCIGGVCTVLKDAGVMDRVDWSNTHFSEHAKEYGFTANQGWGLKGIQNLEPGDVLQYNNKSNEQGNYYPGHSQIYLGKDASGQLRFFDNFWGTEKTYFESEVKDLLDSSRKKTEPSATIYKVNPYNDSNPWGLSPEALQNYKDKQELIEKESKSKQSYIWSVAKNAKNYNDTTKRVIDSFIEYANDNDKINDLVKKTGKSKAEIHDSLLNVFGELGAENNWTTSKGKGIGSRLENIAESVITAFGGGKKLSVGPGQIKYAFIPKDLKEKFNIKSSNDLYDLDKVLPLMTALDLRDKQVLENWGKNNTLSKKLFGFTNPVETEWIEGQGSVPISGGFTVEDLPSYNNSDSTLNHGVGRYSPYLRNQYSSISSGTTWENGDDWLPFNEGTMTNYSPAENNKSGKEEMRVKYERDPGSYPYKVEQNWRDNLDRTMYTTQPSGSPQELDEVIIEAIRKKKTS